MIRLDKYLCDCSIGTRSQVKELIKKGQIQVNNEVMKKPEYKVNEQLDLVSFAGRTISYQPFHYYMLHKPSGVVTATEDKREKTVMELLSAEERKGLFPVGRLDKDTEGLLLITDHGQLAHRLLSPGKKIPKTYFVITAEKITEDMAGRLCEGVDIGEKKLTLPAQVEIVTDNSLYLTITEGKFHQVKRMLKAVENKVIYLKRISMGDLILDGQLTPGEYRSLTKEEILSLNKYL